MATLKRRIARVALTLTLALPLSFALRAQADDPAPAGEKRRNVRQAGTAHGPKLEAQQGPAASAAPENPEAAAARAAVREKLRKQTELAHERLREARARLEQQAVQSRKGGPPELVSNEASDEHATRAKRARLNAWRTMLHRLRQPSEIPPEVRQELREHAQRMARLHRIREVAREKKDVDAQNRANALVGRELGRNRKRMMELWQAFMQRKPQAAPAPAAAPDEDEQDEPDPEEIEEEEAEEEEGVVR
jgi:hypothetical protein